MNSESDNSRCPSCGIQWSAEERVCPGCGRSLDVRPHGHPSFIPGGALPWHMPFAMKLFAVLLIVWIVLTVGLLLHRWP